MLLELWLRMMSLIMLLSGECLLRLLGLGQRKMEKNKYVCELGPGDEYPGGILSVINDYMKSEYLNQFKLKHIVTVSKKHKILGFLKGSFIYILLCIQGRVRLAHIHMSERGSCVRAICLAVISNIFNVPFIIHSHGSEIIQYYNQLTLIRRYFFDRAMNSAKRIIILTPGWSKFWGKIVNKKKLVVIPNFVKVSSELDKKYKKDGRLNVLFLGYVGERKGTYDLVKAINYIVHTKNERNIHLYIAGNGELSKCSALVKKYELKDYITIIGWANDEKKANLFSKSDLLVLPSKYESFGIVILEAMSHKLAVICGDSGFTKELISPGEDGLVAKTGDYVDLAEKILFSSNNLQKFGENGYEKVKRDFSEKVVMKKVRRLYEEVS